MSDYKSIKTEELTKIANAIRYKTGKSDKISLEAMAKKIREIEGGVSLPELENEGSAADLLSGKQLIDSEGNIVTGTIETKNSSNLAANGATVTVPAGYYATQATKSVATATQATPSVSIDSTGKITATATQTAGYVAAGTKSATHQLAFQAAKIITPTTASQIAVSSGYYTGGNITVAAVPTQNKTVTPTSTAQNITPDSGKFLSKVTINGDANLVAGNIKSGVSIFGVNGTYAGSGGGDTSVEDGLITRTISAYTNDRITTIGYGAFIFCTKLSTASFPKCTNIGSSAFFGCNVLTTISFPECTHISSTAFYSCAKLITASFPKCTNIDYLAFANCDSLTTANFPKCTNIGRSAFQDCQLLSTISFPICKMINSGVFYSCAKLSTASFPKCTSIGSSAFHGCKVLTTISFPECTNIGISAFYSCTELTTASFPKCKNIGGSAFQYCRKLSEIYLMNPSICTMGNAKVFSYTSITSSTGSIFVPSPLVAAYKTATNWALFSNRIYGI